MKNLICLFLVLAAVNASAETCYVLSADSAVAPAQIPKEVCLSSLKINSAMNKVSVVSSTDHVRLYKDMQINYVINKSGTYEFSVSSILHDTGTQICDETDRTTLSINGAVKSDGVANVNKLEVIVAQEHMRDSCHSTPEGTIFNYNLKK